MIAPPGARRLRARLAAGQSSPPPRVSRLGALVARAEPARRWAASVSASDPERLLGRCAGCAVLGAALLGTSGHGARAIAGVAVGLLAGWRTGTALHERSARADAAEVRRALPFALDRLSACLLAGMSVERALRLVAPRTSGPLGVAFADGLAAFDIGMTRAQAYARIAERAGIDEVRSLMSALARSERFGVSLSDTLVAQARDLRSRARAAAEAEARTAPVKLIFPLVFCFLPAFVLLTIAPIAISALRTLGKA
ncbi:MAG: type II secretion system F family protein [Actinomycetota bacterium]